MKTQHDTPLQFSGYPLSIVETNQKMKKVELTVVKPLRSKSSNQKTSIANDPKNWDVDWFNSYEWWHEEQLKQINRVKTVPAYKLIEFV